MILKDKFKNINFCLYLMKIEKVLIFATGYSVKKMIKETLDNPNELSKSFRRRVNEFYLTPAKNLSAFAQGVLCFTLIDFLANIIFTDITQVQDYREFIKNNFEEKSFSHKNLTVEDRIITFLIKELRIFPFKYGYSFYKYVRTGLIHEGRIKCGCYLDNRIEDAFQLENGILVFNPKVILKTLELWLKKYYHEIENGGKSYKKLKRYIKNMLNEDSEAILKRRKNTNFPC